MILKSMLSVAIVATALPALAAQKNLRQPLVRVSEKTCEAINKVIHSSVLDKGGTIVLDAGTYVCSEPVVLDRDHVDLTGAGPKRTLIQAKDGYAMSVVIIGSGVNNTVPKETERWGTQLYPAFNVTDIHLSEVAVDGNLGEENKNLECYNSDEPDMKKRGVDCGGDNGKYIRNNGITIRAAKDIVIRNVSAVRALSGGMVTEKGCENLLVDGFYTAANRFDGFAGYETQHSLFKNMLLEKQPYSGISVDLGFINNKFVNVTAQDNKDNGLFSVQVSGNKYVNVKALRNGNKGFYMEGGRGGAANEFIPGTCDGNSFDQIEAIGNGSTGFHINDACKHIVVKSSVVKISSEKATCVYLAEGAEVKFVGGDICKNN